jgi:glycosyltransferase involved in cell wall biosynthesis
MRIAYIVSDFAPVSETFIRDLSHGLHGRGHSVTVFCQRAIPGSYSAQLDVKALGPEPRANPLARVRRLALRGKADLVNEFDWQRREKWFRSTFAPAIRQAQPDVIYAEYGWNGVLASDVALETARPLVIHLHGLDASEYLALPAYVRRLREAAGRGARFIVPSHHLRRRLCVACPEAQNIEVVVPYGAIPSASRIAPIPNSETPPDRKRVVAIGRLTHKKAPQALLHAFALVARAVPDVRLDLVGDGPLRGDVEGTIHRLDIGSLVMLHGAQPHEDALEILRGAQVFAQHSVTSASGDQEGLPVAILEALALGIPVVSTLHSGIPEVVEEGVNGFLVREWDFEAMADRIIHVLQSGFRPQLSAREKILSLDQRVERIEAVLAGALPLTRQLAANR